jgi:lipopolysaccharide export system permease protein
VKKPIPTPQGTSRFRLIDAYLLRLLTWPIIGCLGVTVIALLLERVLRLLDVLSQSSARFGYVTQLAANLVPHYLGLALPVAFFVALFIVITKLSDGSEIDALLASGQSLTRLAAPFVGVGLFLMLFSLMRVRLHAALQPLRLSHRDARGDQRRLERQAERRRLHRPAQVADDGRRRRPGRPAADAGVHPPSGRRRPRGGDHRRHRRPALRPGGKTVTMLLRKGQRIGVDARGEYRTLVFDQFTTNVPLAGAAALLRAAAATSAS